MTSTESRLARPPVMTGLKSWLRRWSGALPAVPMRGSPAPTSATIWVNRGLSVLVVDDNPSNLDMAANALERCGITASFAADGAEAVDLACEKSFDIILMDLQMPVLDGLSATAEIRKFEGTCSRLRTPVVAFSASEVATTLLRDSGMDDRLSKPCSTAELEACLVRWCAGFQPWSMEANGGAAGQASHPQMK